MRWMFNGMGAGLVLAIGTVAQAGDAQFFATPSGWAIGDGGSTHQAWDVLTSPTNQPDIAFTANPSLGATPTLSVLAPGMAVGSGNFYSFSADYAIDATIHNHGGSHGAGVTPGLGTHVIIQAASTLNDDGAGVLPDSLTLVDLAGDVLSGGSAAEALQSAVLFTGIVDSPQGPVNHQERIWEFFLPGYTGDFRVLADVRVHSSFRALQIDTMAGESAFDLISVPEPATGALLALGGVALLHRRTRR